jgi:hypothetical protein
MRPFGFFSERREVQHIKRTCRDCLTLYRKIERDQPASTMGERYAFVVAERTGTDHNGVKAIMRHVEDSFAVWPHERPVKFRDVVQYLAVTECLEEATSESGVRAEVAAVVAKLIAANL